MPYLKSLREEDPQVHVLSRESTTLGRSREADIAIGGDRGISKLHARVEAEPAGYMIVDLGSRNGTYVNDHPVAGEPAPLLPGDRIRIGHTVFVFEEGEPGGPEPDGEAPEGTEPGGKYGRSAGAGLPLPGGPAPLHDGGRHARPEA